MSGMSREYAKQFPLGQQRWLAFRSSWGSLKTWALLLPPNSLEDRGHQLAGTVTCAGITRQRLTGHLHCLQNCWTYLAGLAGLLTKRLTKGTLKTH